MGITYQDAISMPIDLAITLLSSDERPKQTHQAPTPTPQPAASQPLTSSSKRYIASRRKSQS